MIPTAREYAGLCQELQTALSVVELGACLHKWGHDMWILRHCISKSFVSFLVVLNDRKACRGGITLQSSQLVKVPAYLFDKYPAYPLHMQVSDL